MYELDKVQLLHDAPSNYLILDTIVRFMKSHPYLKIEIDNHSDRRYPLHSSSLTKGRAQTVVDTLIKLGIDSARIVAKGWGTDRPLIDPESIKKMQRKSQQDSANALNRRTEITILSIGYSKESFKWTDTEFNLYSKRRLTNLQYSVENGTLLIHDSLNKLTLDTLLSFLKKNSHLKIEIGCHTGQLDSDVNSLVASQAKANSIMDYLVSQGIDSTRLTARGYGSKEPQVNTYGFDINDFSDVNTKKRKEKDAIYNRRTIIMIIGL